MGTATVTRPSATLPDPGDTIDAEPIRDYITNVLAFLESASLKSGNVVTDTSGNTDAVLVQDVDQVVNSKKDFVSTAAGAGGLREVIELALNPSSGSAADNDGIRVVLRGDDSAAAPKDFGYFDLIFTDVSPGTEDAKYSLKAMVAGSVTELMEISSTGVDILAGGAFTIDGSEIGGVNSASTVTWTGNGAHTSTDQNGQRVVFFDLDNPLHVWDEDRFMQLIQRTSWHDELGDPPRHGLFFITEAQDKLVWWNRDTGAAYMTFDTGTNYILNGASATLTSVAVQDGKILVGDSAGSLIFAFIDLLEDRGGVLFTNAAYLRPNTIAERNTAITTGSISVGTGLFGAYLVNGVVNDVAMCRDPDEVDEFGRPKHWWVAGTDGGASVYNPITDAIYDSSITDDVDFVHLTDGGALSFTRDEATRDYTYVRASIFGISADSWTGDTNATFSNQGTDAQDIAFGDALIHGPVTLLDGASWAQQGMPVLWLASDTGGAYAIHLASDYRNDSGLIRLHEDYASPYMKGDVRGCWPLHSTADVSPGGHTLTNNNTVTFDSGGPCGSYADFVAASSMSLSLADHADFGAMSALSIFCWIYRDVDSGGIEALVSKWDSNAASYAWDLHVNANDGITANLYTAGGNDGPVSATGIIGLGAWHHVGFTYDGTTIKSWVDGVNVGSASGTASGAVNNSTGAVRIGARDAASPTSFFDGRIGGVVVSATAMTEREVKAEYARGLRRIESTIDTNDTITDNDIAAVAADPVGKYVIIGGVDKTVQIWDELCCPVLSDTYAGTALRDVAITTVPGGADPHYVMMGSDQFESVQPVTRI